MQNIKKVIKRINQINENYHVYCQLDDERGRYFRVYLGRLDETTLPFKTYNTIDECFCNYDENYEKNILNVLKEYENKIKGAK